MLRVHGCHLPQMGGGSKPRPSVDYGMEIGLDAYQVQSLTDKGRVNMAPETDCSAVVQAGVLGIGLGPIAVAWIAFGACHCEVTVLANFCLRACVVVASFAAHSWFAGASVAAATVLRLTAGSQSLGRRGSEDRPVGPCWRSCCNLAGARRLRKAGWLASALSPTHLGRRCRCCKSACSPRPSAPNALPEGSRSPKPRRQAQRPRLTSVERQSLFPAAAHPWLSPIHASCMQSEC